jgi:hypothetical protein
MGYQALRNLRIDSKYNLFHTNPTFFADPFTIWQRFFSFNLPTYKLMARLEPLQYIPLDEKFSNIPAVLDPHSYTKGRWLRHDKLEREARYVKFNFDALRNRVVELCTGAMSIVSYEKKEGGFNRAFIFTMDDARRVVARPPTRTTGPARLTTNSEVATINYCASSASIRRRRSC